MSRASDTISRNKLMTILRDDVQLQDDELRMCRLLLADTSLQVRLRGQLSKPFQTTIAWDTSRRWSVACIVRCVSTTSQAAGSQNCEGRCGGLPREAIYADDTDFFSTDISYLKQLEANIPPHDRCLKLGCKRQ